MFHRFTKGKAIAIGGDGDGWTIDSPFYWYRHTDNWKIAEVDTTNAIDSYKRIYFRIKLKGGTNYLMGQGYNHHANDTVYDGRIVLFDINGNELISDDHTHREINGEIFQDCVEYTPSADGVYILACGSFTYNGRSGKFPVCCYPAPEQEQQGVVYETSSGFNTLGMPIGYRSAGGVGIEYSPIDIPKDGLVFYADYKNGKDRVTKTQGECNNVDFMKYKGCNCAYFNGVDSSILWKNILTSDLQHYTIFTKFSALPKEHWGMIFGISPENKRTQGYSMKTHGEYLSYTNRGSDKGGASITYDTFCVGTLVGYGEWIEIYLNGTVYLGHSASSIPANSWLYNGIDFGYTNVDPQPYYGYIAESIVYNRTFSKDELQALTQQLLNKGA